MLNGVVEFMEKKRQIIFLREIRVEVGKALFDLSFPFDETWLIIVIAAVVLKVLG